VSHQGALLGGKFLIQLRAEGFWYRLVTLAEIAFQACLIDRSSISPSLESITCGLMIDAKVICALTVP
jgi:hypothetical protein